MTYSWKTHNVLSAVLYWLRASHTLTQSQGEGKYALPLSGKSVKIITRHVFKGYLAEFFGFLLSYCRKQRGGHIAPLSTDMAPGDLFLFFHTIRREEITIAK